MPPNGIGGVIVTSPSSNSKIVVSNLLSLLIVTKAHTPLDRDADATRKLPVLY